MMRPEDLYDAVDKLNSRDGWIADRQTKGRMLENLVRSYIGSILPPGRGLRVETGCIWNGRDRGELPQSDLIVFQDTLQAVPFDAHGVVVVRDNAVKAIVSVKTNLSKLDVSTEIPDYRDLLQRHPPL